jgi:hypothetical protein
MTKEVHPRFRWRPGDLLRAIRYALFVLASGEQLMGLTTVKTRGEMERVFVLAVLGDLHGVPLLPARCRMQLLPYLVPQVLTWRRHTLGLEDATGGASFAC